LINSIILILITWMLLGYPKIHGFWEIKVFKNSKQFFGPKVEKVGKNRLLNYHFSQNLGNNGTYSERFFAFNTHFFVLRLFSSRRKYLFRVIAADCSKYVMIRKKVKRWSVKESIGEFKKTYTVFYQDQYVRVTIITHRISWLLYNDIL
jgi:hypothetical protein